MGWPVYWRHEILVCGDQVRVGLSRGLGIAGRSGLCTGYRSRSSGFGPRAVGCGYRSRSLGWAQATAWAWFVEGPYRRLSGQWPSVAEACLEARLVCSGMHAGGAAWQYHHCSCCRRQYPLLLLGCANCRHQLMCRRQHRLCSQFVDSNRVTDGHQLPLRAYKHG